MGPQAQPKSLRQRVDAYAVLGGKFIEVRCKQSDAAVGVPPYEAIYLIGHDSENGKMVFHLFDSLGVASDYRYGVGQLHGSRARFVFVYHNGEFFNEIELQPTGWLWRLSFIENGEERLFAEKRLTVARS